MVVDQPLGVVRQALGRIPLVILCELPAGFGEGGMMRGEAHLSAAKALCHRQSPAFVEGRVNGEQTGSIERMQFDVGNAGQQHNLLLKGGVVVEESFGMVKLPAAPSDANEYRDIAGPVLAQ